MKVGKDIDRSKGFVYLYKGNYHCDIPDDVKLVRVKYDKNMDTNVVKCRKKRGLTIFNMLLIVVLVLQLQYIVENYKVINYDVYFENVILRNGQYLEVNLTSSESNTCSAQVRITNSIGEEVIRSREVKPGESIGTVDWFGGTGNKSEICNLELTVYDSDATIKRDYTIVVKEK